MSMASHKYRSESNDFRRYCRTLTDTQLRNVLAKEYDATRRGVDHRRPNYLAAKAEAEARGWVVSHGREV